MITLGEEMPVADQQAVAAIHLLLADGQRFVHVGLRSLLGAEPSIALVGEAPSCSAALMLLAQVRPNVIAVSHELPGDLLEFFYQVRTVVRDAEIILYGVPPSSTVLVEALRFGVKGFVDHTAEFRDLLAAILAVAAGSIVITPRVVQQLGSIAVALGLEGARSDRNHRETLTAREREILEHVAGGVSNRDMALAIGLSEHTVRAHLRGIMRKLNARSRVQAVSIGIQQGVIAPPPR